MRKIAPTGLLGPSRSLLVSVYFRAVESRRVDPILRDDLARELVERIAYDFTPFDADLVTQVATALRARQLDRWTQAFLAEAPGALVVNLGCGLCTRLSRVDDGAVRWVDLDLPEVIALRRELVPEGERNRLIARSALDLAWAEELPPEDPEKVLFLAEGVLPYLAEPEVRRLVAGLGRRFPGARLLFDAVSPLQAALSVFHPTLWAVGARFRWGLHRPEDAERWAPGLRVLRSHFYLRDLEPRLGWFGLVQLLPQVAQGFTVVECRLGQRGSMVGGERPG